MAKTAEGGACWLVHTEEGDNQLLVMGAYCELDEAIQRGARQQAGREKRRLKSHQQASVKLPWAGDKKIFAEL